MQERELVIFGVSGRKGSSMTMMANKPPVGVEQIVTDFITREGRSLVRMARELPNQFITDELLVKLDTAL